MRHAVLLASLGLCVALAGCATSVGAWTDEGFEHTTYGWKAVYPEGQHELLGSNWRLDNWEPGMDGTLQQKSGAAYASRVDENGDGVIDAGETRTVYFEDLKFTNVHNNGIIWVKSRKLDESDAGKDLDVLLENYVSALTGGGGLAWRNLRAVVSSRSDVKLGPYPAASAEIRVEPLKESSDTHTTVRFEKVHLVLTKFVYLGPVEGSVGEPTFAPESTGPVTTTATPGHRERFTAVFVVGYVNDSQRFDGGLADFAKLLGQLKMPDPPPAPTARKMTGKKKPPGPLPATTPDSSQPAGPAATPPAAPAKPSTDPDKPSLEI